MLRHSHDKNGNMFVTDLSKPGNNVRMFVSGMKKEAMGILLIPAILEMLANVLI